MTEIKSEKGMLKTKKEAVHELLSDLNNLESFLPQEKVSNWDSDGKSCSFKVMGTYTIGLELSDETTPSKVVYKSTEKSPFPFTLNTHLEETTENLTEAKIVCEASLNTMLKMMVTKPLKNLFDYIVKKAEEHYS